MIVNILGKPQTSNPRHQTPKHQTPNIKPQTSNPKHQTPNIKPQTETLQPELTLYVLVPVAIAFLAGLQSPKSQNPAPGP
jgi:hypothetical protein